jgi:hypothetical protein
MKFNIIVKHACYRDGFPIVISCGFAMKTREEISERYRNNGGIFHRSVCSSSDEESSSTFAPETTKRHIVRSGNFSGSSRLMESFILEQNLSQLRDKFQQENVSMEITIDGDLSLLDKLRAEPYIERIFIDLPHKLKNIRKRVAFNYGSALSVYEDVVVDNFRDYCYAAAKRNLEQPNEVSEKNLMFLMTDAFYSHLQDDHHLCCWKEICWQLSNPELDIREPNLKGKSLDFVESFKAMVSEVYRVHSGQNLITYVRTTSNEALNHCKNLRLPKSVNNWKTFPLRYYMTLLSNNLSYSEYLVLIRECYGLPNFTCNDILHLSDYEECKRKQRQRNRDVISVQLSKKKQKIIEMRDESRIFHYNNLELEYGTNYSCVPSWKGIISCPEQEICLSCKEFPSYLGMFCRKCNLYIELGWEKYVFNEARKILKEQKLEPCIIDSTTMYKALKHIWGFPFFRDIQEQIIHSFMLGNDTWGIMKTGNGNVSLNDNLIVHRWWQITLFCLTINSFS